MIDTDKDFADVTNALVRWFHSQEVDEAEMWLIMCNLLARMVVGSLRGNDGDAQYICDGIDLVDNCVRSISAEIMKKNHNTKAA